MRNLFMFIWKNHFFFLFILLQSVALYMLFSNNHHHRSTYLSSANSITGNVYNAYTAVSDYFTLSEANKELAEENARLYAYNKTAYDSYVKDAVTINDTVYRQKYVYRSAKVVSNNVSGQRNYVTLNIGRKQGIGKDMAVIAPTGVVGIVKDVSDNFSSVMSLLHRDTRISAKLLRDGSFGPLIWEGDDYLHATLTDIPTHVQVALGDTVVTSAYSTLFPEGVMIGSVSKYERKAGDYFYTIEVKLSTAFKRLNYVYVIENVLKEEQEALEASTKENDN